ncbi:amidohydrolase [Rubritalea marina]|uniref:amidohydrolase n=1 Tax=Rubritalea marina TaxID=361055 RepID=UPI0012EA063C|nr:amidohydrolase [Rubritalea marina]
MKLQHSLMALLTLSASATLCAATADTIYFNGPIITIDDQQPSAQAVAVKDGKILAVGSKESVMQAQGPNTTNFDLQGKTMLPGFVDAHGHVMGGGLQALSANLLAPPDGEVQDIASLQQTLRDWIRSNREAVEKLQLVVGFGYDNAQLKELRHPTKQDLDAVTTDFPVIIVHQSGHIVSANSKALEAGKITPDSPNPDGGVIRRMQDGKEPDGVLEETAAFPLLITLLSRVGTEGSEVFFKAGAELWARFGYTTAQDGRSTPGSIPAMKKVAASGALKIDVVSYPDVLMNREIILKELSSDYTNRFRVAGAKLTIDGSPQGFTAWRDRPYYDPVGNYEPGYAGYPAATAEQVSGAIQWAYEHDIQILTHSNGEAASDLLLAHIHAATRRHGAGDRRPVLIHGQFLREDQVDSMRQLGVIPSLFPMHTFYWGDWHREHTVGPILSNDISPTGWCVKRGMRFTSHHDAPVAFPNSMRVLDATVTRRSRSGDIIGPDHRVDVMTALKAMTLWPAWQHFEEDTKGSIEPGKLADFVILDKDPRAVDPETLDKLVVLKTIKEDQVIFDIAESSALRSVDEASVAFARSIRAVGPSLGNPCPECLCRTLSELTKRMIQY